MNRQHASLDPGPAFDPFTIKPKLLALLAALLLAVPVAAAPRVTDTEDPSPISGGMQDSGDPYGRQLLGDLSSERITLEPGLDSTGGNTCSNADAGRCATACDQQINNPFCTSFSACMPASGGGVSCVCTYFCMRIQGHTYDPKELMVTGEPTH